MVKHVVMWRIKEFAEGSSKSENIAKFKAMLNELPSKLTKIDFKVEVGEDFYHSARSYDLCLVSEFKSKEDLEYYRIHPDHVKVAEFGKKVVEISASADYEFSIS